MQLFESGLTVSATNGILTCSNNLSLPRGTFAATANGLKIYAKAK